MIIRSVVEQEVEDVHAGVGFCLVELGIAAAQAGNGDEFFVLDIEHAGEGAAGGLELIGFVFIAAAFGAHILYPAVFVVGHNIPLQNKPEKMITPCGARVKRVQLIVESHFVIFLYYLYHSQFLYVLYHI